MDFYYKIHSVHLAPITLAYAANISNHMQWNSRIADIKRLTGHGCSIGTQWLVSAQYLGGMRNLTLTVTHQQGDVILVSGHNNEGRTRCEIFQTWRVEPKKRGSLLHYHLKIQVEGWGILNFLLRLLLARTMSQTAYRLQQKLSGALPTNKN